MAQPWQLAKAHKPRRSTKPILEQLPCVAAHELKISSLFTGKSAIIRPLRIADIAAVKVSLTDVEFHLKSLHRGVEGPVQRFNVKPIKTGWGIRYAFICNCGKGCIKLYLHHGSLMCGKCCNGRYASRAISRTSRPVLQALRLADFLDSKPLWRQAKERLRKKFGDRVLRAQGQFGTDARPVSE